MSKTNNYCEPENKVIRITDEFFAMPIIRKALVSAEANFFRFNNLVEHIR